ncbi:MAG: hypothetical protein H7A45_13285 [Verrucomicrobiales bacterium]|nr:hypothetical protein [Verrucomicrobiales bacterium]
METGPILLGLTATAVVFGPLFLARQESERPPIRWREFFRSLIEPVARRGLTWAVGLPVLWMALYYGFIAHVWFRLGRWPRFGEPLEGWLVSTHYELCLGLLKALVFSLPALPVVIVAGLVRARWRHLPAYALAYGAAVGLAWGALFVAPHAFLNWLFD